MIAISQISVLITQIFDIINYHGDRDKLIGSIVRIASSNALLDAVDTLPEGKAEELAHLLESKAPEEGLVVLQEYFDNKEFEDIFMQNLRKTLTSFITDGVKSITEEQRQQVLQLISTAI